VDKQDQYGNVTREEEKNKETTQALVKTTEENVEVNINTGNENAQSTFVTIIYSIDTTPITYIPGRLVFTSFDFDSIQPIQDIVMSLNTYTFDDTTKTIMKRINKKINIAHHEETK
jgi:hypothetical protein